MTGPTGNDGSVGGSYAYGDPTPADEVVTTADGQYILRRGEQLIEVGDGPEEQYRTIVSEGDRIELVQTDDPYTLLEPGDRGTMVNLDVDPPEVTPSDRPQIKIWVEWDSGSTLALIVGKDNFITVSEDDKS